MVVAGVAIRQDGDGRFCLNDLHRAAGSERRHGPALWMENQQTKELVAEVAQELSDTGNPVSVIKGGKKQGTYVCKELVYAYAMWISAKFHLKVIRAYDKQFGPSVKEDTSLFGRRLALETKQASSARLASLGGSWLAQRREVLRRYKVDSAKLDAQIQQVLFGQQEASAP